LLSVKFDFNFDFNFDTAKFEKFSKFSKSFWKKIPIKIGLPMEHTVKERLIQFIKYKGLSQRKFEIEVGLSNGYINNIMNGIGVLDFVKLL
jgi:hypothetical protein